jgi:hypothetical protein
MKITEEILQINIVAFAFYPFLLLAVVYYRLQKKAGFKNIGEARLEIIRATFGYLAPAFLIANGLFNIIPFYWDLFVFVSMLVVWYLIERYIRKKHRMPESFF